MSSRTLASVVVAIVVVGVWAFVEWRSQPPPTPPMPPMPWDAPVAR